MLYHKYFNSRVRPLEPKDAIWRHKVFQVVAKTCLRAYIEKMGNDDAEKIIDLLTDESVVAVSGELLQLGLEELIKNEAFEKLPVIGGILSIGKTGYGLNEMLFARKIVYLLKHIADVPVNVREKYQRRLKSDKQKRRTGIALLEMINKSSSDGRVTIIAELFRLHLYEKINENDFITMAEMITGAYSSDLIYFATKHPSREDDTAEHLLNLGFYTQPYKRFGDTLMTVEAIYKSKLGEKMYEAMKNIGYGKQKE